MVAEAARGMISNAALLLTLGVLYFFIPLRSNTRTLNRKIFLGFIIGLIGIALMLSRWELLPGLFFDTRSILLVVTGLFFGTIPTAIASVMLIAFRLFQGGVGAFTGVGVIVCSSGIGLFWRRYFIQRRGWLDYYFVGIAVHVVMLGWMLVMPKAIAVESLRQISIPVLLIYPIGTMLLAKLLDSQRYRRDAREEALRNERKLRGMMEKSWGLIIMIDQDERTIYVSESVGRLLGYNPKEFLRMGLERVIHPDDKQEAQRTFEQLRSRPGEAITQELRLLHREGRWVWFESVATNLLDEPDVAAIVINSQDVTDRNRAHRVLQVERQRLVNIIEGTEVGTWEWNVQTGETTLDDRWSEMIGYTLEELSPTTADTWQKLVHPEDLKSAEQKIKQHFAGEVERYECEYRMSHKSGRWVWVLDLGKVIEWTEDGKPLRMFGTHTDITSRKQDEQDQYLIANMMENAQNEIYIFADGDLCFTQINQRALKNLGYSFEELKKLTPLDLKPEITPEEFNRMIEPLIQGESEGIRFETVHLRKDGTRYPVEVHLSYQKKFHRFMAIINDITERREFERNLAESEELYRSIFNKHSAVKLLIDVETGMITDANEAAAEFYGWSVDELKQMRIHSINTLEPEILHDSIETVRSGERVRFDFRHRRADGSIRDVEVFSSRIVVSGKDVLHSIVHDVTDRRKLEEQLRQSQKMEAVGRLAGGVAHDFNNMLSVIIGTAEMAIQGVDPQSNLYRDLRQITETAHRSADLTRQLLTFSRKQLISPVVLNLNQQITKQEKMLSRMIGEDIEIRLVLADELWNVFIDPSQIDQIITNLCVNARDAIRGVGTLTIETGNVFLDEDYSRADMPVQQGDYIMLTISDSGIGMDAEILEHIFEPFFTTKLQGKGTGLGLATIYGIVKQNNGVIHVYSDKEFGTTFKIYLPRFVGEERLVDEKRELEFVGGTETILIAEDEVLILNLLKQYLEKLGYTVLIANSPSEAIQIVKEYEDEIHLLLTDVVMPEMNGKELEEKLKSIKPQIRTLFMSGYSAEIIAQRGVLEEGIEFIQKPFTMRAVTQRVRLVLDKK